MVIVHCGTRLIWIVVIITDVVLTTGTAVVYTNIHGTILGVSWGRHAPKSIVLAFIKWIQTVPNETDVYIKIAGDASLFMEHLQWVGYYHLYVIDDVKKSIT